MRAVIKLNMMVCFAAIMVLCLVGCTDSGGSGNASRAAARPPADRPPVDRSAGILVPESPEIEAVKNEKAVLDYSNASSGYICAKSFIAPTMVKVLVEVSGVQYQYSIVENDGFIVIPLSCGDGDYAVSLWENVFQDQYAAIFSQEIQVSLSDEFLPFLYPNQFVEFNAGNEAIAVGAELTSEAGGVVETIEDIYDYVISNIEYDFEKAATVGPGYLPSIDETLRTKKGICFDYAVLTAAMLRARDVPTKLVIGYAGPAYHAWIEAYSSEEGWIRKEIYFDGRGYVLMDPTFASAGNGGTDMTAAIGDGNHYDPRFYY
ncbi:MAG: transglutaminase-like domain-containing protein [Clostridiales Family XIII bacterium]|jgi:hypothetical protein|nr:transglutaminase-like domain-containing protein [Clostridiales Family XIII bacterium]